MSFFGCFCAECSYFLMTKHGIRTHFSIVHAQDQLPQEKPIIKTFYYSKGRAEETLKRLKLS